MTKASSKKVCIVVSSLGVGGAERSSALLSEMLFELGMDVHIVSVLDKIEYPYKGKLLNLGKLKAEDDSKIGRLKRLTVFKNYLKTNHFDYVIDNRTRIGFFKELIISKWVYKANKTIYCVRSYNTDMYINPNRLLAKLLYKSANKIVTVSKAISDKLRDDFGFNNLQVIYNPVSIDTSKAKTKLVTDDNYILFFGRLDDAVKNISLLLEAYSKSKLQELNVKLKILGSGKDQHQLIHKTEALGLKETVDFLGFQSNPYEMVKNAKFTVLTSRYEGFPRALVESLAMETPVVSVDCKSGPNEIVVNEYNGLLVENYNVEALSKAFDRMVADKKLYLHCKSNSKASINAFTKNSIAQHWQTLLS